MRRLWPIPAVGAVAVTLITWLPMLTMRFPGLGLPPYHPAVGIDLWAMQAWWLAVVVGLALLVWESDRWLSAAMLLAGLTIFLRGARLDPTHGILFTIGALLLVAVRRTPGVWVPRLRWLLAASGIFQIGYCLQQSFLHYDVLWGPMWGPTVFRGFSPQIQPLGTLGTVDAAGAYIALTAPLMPLWALPFAGIAVWQGHSVGALLALVVGLTVRYARTRWTGLTIMGLGLASLITLATLKGLTGTIVARITVWRFGLEHAAASDPVVGWGLGGWASHVPPLQMQLRVMPTNEVFREAHSEPLQWAAETGIIGIIILAGWLWTHRAMWTHPLWGGSIAALAADSLTFFPLHVVALAFLAITVVGLATPQTERSQPYKESPSWH